ncbi:hypothetical protein Hanom_Chr08g00697961 [Helianthus anomalus]
MLKSYYKHLTTIRQTKTYRRLIRHLGAFFLAYLFLGGGDLGFKSHIRHGLKEISRSKKLYSTMVLF